MIQVKCLEYLNSNFLLSMTSPLQSFKIIDNSNELMALFALKIIKIESLKIH